MKAKQKYRNLCQVEHSIPLPSKDWWLDVVAGEDNWNVVLAERGDQIVASMPFVFKKKLGFDIIHMPPFTPSMGVWVKYPENQKYANKLSFEKKIFTELIEQLPRFDRFQQRFHVSFTNWLPFFWKGFEQTTRYTYVIENLNNLDKIFSNFRENIRREIRKAQRQLNVFHEESIEKLYRLQQLTYKRQGLTMEYSLPYLENINHACIERKCGKIYYAEDQEGRLHSALFLIWDNERAYYLIGGSDPAYRNSGAASLLMWNAIQYAATVTRKFDFEGSMIEPIERFFRGFGAIQKPYFSIYKNNWLFKFIDAYRTKK